jgi:serine/threonine protein kinase
MPYNIIPVGDHCATAMILKELNYRIASYPFDWVTDSREDVSCIHDNLALIHTLQDTSDTSPIDIVTRYIGDATTGGTNINSHTYRFFPHDVGTPQEIHSKYIRRFERLANDIRTKKNLFILLTRWHVIEKEQLDLFISRMRSYNPDNRFLVISGIEHPYLNESQYTSIVTYKYIQYDKARRWEYDYSHFRPEIKRYFASMTDLFV